MTKTQNVQVITGNFTNSPLQDDGVWNFPVWRQTKNGITTDLPYESDVYGNAGYVFGFRSVYEDMRWDGMVFFINYKNEVWIRKVKQDRDRTDRHYEGEWTRVGGTGTLPPDLSNFLKKPEAQDQITNIDEPTESGFMKTGDRTTAGSLPEGVSQSAKWGLVVNLFENTSNGTMFQMWFSLSGPTKGHRYTRGRENNKWTKWVDISAGGPSVTNYWGIPTQTLQDVNGTHDTGYYFTAPNATGMEGVPQDKRDGIVKIIKDEAGGVSIQEYTSSVQGDNAVYVRTIPITSPIARDVPSEWTQINTDAKIPIRKEAIKVDLKPHDYAGLGDQVIYQFAFPNTIGLTSSSKAVEGYVVLLTIIADDIMSDQSHQTEQRYGFINQYAYCRDGRVFVRSYNHPKENTEVQPNAPWTNNWKELKAGSGKIDEKTFKEWLKNDFTSWSSQALPDEGQAFKKWHDNTQKLKYESWIQGSSQDSPEEKQHFDNYVKSIVPSGGTGIDFHEWIYHN